MLIAVKIYGKLVLDFKNTRRALQKKIQDGRYLPIIEPEASWPISRHEADPRKEREVKRPTLLPSLIILCLVQSCRTAGMVSVSKAARSKAREIWNYREQAIELALGPAPDKPVELGGFPEAVKFFEELTGIMLDTGTYYGRLPTEGLESTYEQWQHWYAINSNRLYWDKRAKKVEVLPP